MKLTPLDIHHKEFHRAIRGYNEEEVDRFLDEVAEEFERVFKDNIELKEQNEQTRKDMEKYMTMENALHNALLTAQKSAEDVTGHAQKEAELILRDAELKGKEIIQEAYDLKKKYESSLNQLKQAEEEFRSKFKAMLESYVRIADSTAILAEIGNNVPGFNEKPSEIEKIITGDAESPEGSPDEIEKDTKVDKVDKNNQSTNTNGDAHKSGKPMAGVHHGSNGKMANGRAVNGKPKNFVAPVKVEGSGNKKKAEADSMALQS